MNDTERVNFSELTQELVALRSNMGTIKHNVAVIAVREYCKGLDENIVRLKANMELEGHNPDIVQYCSAWINYPGCYVFGLDGGSEYNLSSQEADFFREEFLAIGNKYGCDTVVVWFGGDDKTVSVDVG